LGVKNRLVLSDAAWERMAPLIIGRPDQKGSTGRDKIRRSVARAVA
jgi:putative transposase